jgi:thiamine phosphate synthase YjbQ (UPF0047 family)
MNFSLAHRDLKVIIKTLVDISSPAELEPVLKAYKDLVQKHTVTKGKLLVLFDIRSLSITILNPKVTVLKALTDFFLKLTPFSESHVARVAIMLSNDRLASVIRSALTLYPSKVPTTTSTDLEACKTFLKQ